MHALVVLDTDDLMNVTLVSLLCLNIANTLSSLKAADETTTDVMICIHLLWLCIIIGELLVRLSTFKVVHVVREDGFVADNVTAYLIVNNWAKQFDDLNTAYSLFLSPDGRSKVRNMTWQHLHSNFTLSPERIPALQPRRDLSPDEVLRVALLKSHYINGDLVQDIRFLGERSAVSSSYHLQPLDYQTACLYMLCTPPL